MKNSKSRLIARLTICVICVVAIGALPLNADKGDNAINVIASALIAGQKYYPINIFLIIASQTLISGTLNDTEEKEEKPKEEKPVRLILTIRLSEKD